MAGGGGRGEHTSYARHPGEGEGRGLVQLTCYNPRVTTNVVVRGLDLEAMNVQDGRRLEVIADGLPLHHDCVCSAL